MLIREDYINKIFNFNLTPRIAVNGKRSLFITILNIMNDKLELKGLYLKKNIINKFETHHSIN